MNVSRLTHAQRKEISSLRAKKSRDEVGECVVEGKRSVEAAALAGARIRLLVVTDETLSDPEIRKLSSSAEAVLLAGSRDMDRVSDVKTSQGVLGVVKTAWSDLASAQAAKRVIALDGIQDPGNVGTIIRTAAWFDVGAVLVGPGVADPYGPKVLRASMGGVWDCLLVRSERPADDLRTLASGGLTLYAADLEGQPLETWDPSLPSCLILGSEAHGLSAGVRQIGAERIKIPRRRIGGATESLNVAVAAGILMSSWQPQRVT